MPGNVNPRDQRLWKIIYCTHFINLIFKINIVCVFGSEINNLFRTIASTRLQYVIYKLESMGRFSRGLVCLEFSVVVPQTLFLCEH